MPGYGKSTMKKKGGKKMSAGQKKIAKVASPKSRITGADFKKLRKKA